MSTLKEQCSQDPTRSLVVDDCVQMVDQEVSNKGGMSGLAIKGAYKAVNKIKPGFVRAAVDGLLDGWLENLESFYTAWKSGEGAFSDYLAKRPDDVSNALLTVTDDRAQSSKHKTAAKLYNKLRPTAQSNVSQAVPKLGVLLEKHLQS